MAKILVLDDDDLFRQYLTTLLERAGHEVQALPNGAKVDKLIARESFDAVVTDLYMPESDGLDTLRRVKKHSPRLPVIGVTSGEADDPCIRAMLVMGAEVVLTKPLDEAVFMAAVNSAIARSQSPTRPA